MRKMRPKSKSKRRDSAGPRYPPQILREIGQPLDLNDRNRKRNRKTKKPKGDAETGDVYEYEEATPQEESGKNKRFDRVEKLEYESPSEFEDEEIDEDAAFGGEEGADEVHGEMDVGGDEEDDDDDDGDDDVDDDDRYNRMIEDVTGKSLEKDIDEDEGEKAQDEGPATMQDFLAPLQDKPGFTEMKRRMKQLDQSAAAAPSTVPLAKTIQEKMDRKAGYEKTSEDITKWQPIVKKNREAPTINFNKRKNYAYTSTAEMVADFEPRTKLELEVAALLEEHHVRNDQEIVEGEMLILNKLPPEEVKQRLDRLAKMRHLLFRHEKRQQRINKIKSKTYRRMLKRGEKSKPDLEFDDPEKQKEEAEKQEFKRAQERMTLKHRNTSKWAKRILQRGLHSKEDGTRDAIAEQLRQHALLTKKVNSATADGSSDEEDGTGTSESDVEDEQPGLVLDRKRNARIVAKAKMATLEALQAGQTELPKKGLFSLPFMARAMEMKKKEAGHEAAVAMEELELAEENGEVVARDDLPTANGTSGRLAFGSLAAPAAQTVRDEHEMVERGTDSEESEDEGPVPSRQNKPIDNDNGAIQRAAKEFDGVSVEEMLEAARDRATAVQGAMSVGTDPTANTETATRTVETDNDTVTRTVDSDTTGTVSPTGKKKNKRNQRKKSKKLKRLRSAVAMNPGIFGNGERKEQTDPAESVPVATPREPVTIAGRPKSKAEKVKDAEPMQVDDGDHQVDAGGDAGSDDDHDVVAAATIEDDDDQNMDIMKKTQEEWVREGFAEDNVAEFQEQKAKTMENEGIKQEEIVDLPGWGQWTDVQQKHGAPQWLKEKKEKQKKERLAVEKLRRDAKMNNVIISERPDNKSAKFLTPSVPFPYTSEDMYETTLRMPIGRDFNTNQAFRDLTKPAEIKRAGVIIDPIVYEEPPAKPTGAKRKSSNPARGTNKKLKK